MPRKEMRGRYRSVRIVQYNVIGYKELNLVSHFGNQTSKTTEVIHAVEFASYSVGRQLTPRKHLGCLNFPIIINGSFSEPLMFEQTSTVTLSLFFFPPVHTAPAKGWVLSGNKRQYKPVSSALKI